MKTINGQQWKDAILSGVNALSNNKERIDTLNVFPVPDGDTGSNMGSTVEYAGNEISALTTKSIGEMAAKFSRGMLLGARGNSGVILSQFFKGISVGLEGVKDAKGKDIVKAFAEAKEYAYKSVMKPIEGTILTVIRETAEGLKKKVKDSDDIITVMKLAQEFSRKSCDNTPNILPVLKEVGVVDSGGEGLCVFIEGMALALQGKPVAAGEKASGAVGDFVMEGEDFEGEFGYCTEFILELKAPKAFDKNKFEKAIVKFGGSLVLVQDENIVKTHIHAFKPGNVLTFAQKFGEFLKIKVDNMTLQANESSASKKEAAKSKKSGKDSKLKTKVGKSGIAVIACNTGQGIIDTMEELGVHYIIDAGQSSNPSAQDFMTAIKETGAKKVLILPNNSNIILAAQQVAQTSKEEVIVIPSKTQMQGISAMMNFDPEGSMEDNHEAMKEAIAEVKTGQVTTAARTTKIKGVSVKKGEYLAIAEKDILKSTKSKVEAANIISKKLIDKYTEIVTIYYGDDSTETDAQEVASFIETHYECEVEIKHGNQKVYNFLISYE